MMIVAALSSAGADRLIDVRLNNDGHNEESVSIAGLCNIVVKLEENDENDQINVAFSIENLQETRHLLLFQRPYTEKDLKAQPNLSITYDKLFPGDKNNRTIDYCSDLKADCSINPMQSRHLMTIANCEDSVSCSLPIYIAEYIPKSLFRKEKLSIVREITLNVNIKIDLKPDEAYLALKSECDSLASEISRLVLCNNPKHRPTIKEQKDLYQAKLDSCTAKVDSILNYMYYVKDYYSEHPRYKLYAVLKTQLEEIDLEHVKTEDCGKHKINVDKTRHNCKYCRLSMQEIYHRLDEYYQRIYSSNNRKAAKESIMGDVKALHKCAASRSEWRDSEYKAKISDRYNRINNF